MMSSYTAQVAAQYSHTVFLTDTGATYATGYNSAGQLGDGTKTNQYKPTRVITVPGQYAITSISAGFYHSCATAGDAAVMCWGRNK